MRRLRAAALLALLCLRTAYGDTCPSANFTPGVEGFSSSRFLGIWFPQLQAVTPNAPASSLYCVRLDQRKQDEYSQNLVLFLQSQESAVGGEQRNDEGVLLEAVAVDPLKGLYRAGRPGAPRRMYSPYWVVAVAPTDGDVDAGQPLPYAWCIVLGGPPTEPGASPGTCRPPSSRHRKCNGGGLGGGLSGDGCWNQYEKLGDIFWLLLRAQEADTATLTAARAAASALGLDLSVLLPVAQAGCKYIDRGAAVVAAAPAPAPAPGSDPGPGCGGNGYGEDE